MGKEGGGDMGGAGGEGENGQNSLHKIFIHLIKINDKNLKVFKRLS